jgi:metal-responsive CopG/Arc/MetJ family transcriptional regulator
MTMRPSQTITISLPRDLAEQVDRLAAKEHRTRSELLREAFRRYLASRERWERVLDNGARAAEAAGLDSEAAIDAAVDEATRDVRKQRSQPR